jgi:hypothetical protein
LENIDHFGQGRQRFISGGPLQFEVVSTV